MAGNNNQVEWRRVLRRLEGLIEMYEGANNALKRDLEPRIIEAMLRLAEIHPDSAVREYWGERAAAFDRADSEAKDHILADVGKGLLILLAAPFALAGAVIFAAGGIVYGAGSIVVGLGNLMTGGFFRRK